MYTIIEGEISPAMGPTAEWWWQGANSIAPDVMSASASSHPCALPSKISAPTAAPFIGPAIRSHVTGGPACSSRFSRMPGITSRARPTPISTGRASIIRSTAVRFACSMSIMLQPSFVSCA